jgi:hypothetical protein
MRLSPGLGGGVCPSQPPHAFRLPLFSFRLTRLSCRCLVRVCDCAAVRACVRACLFCCCSCAERSLLAALEPGGGAHAPNPTPHTPPIQPTLPHPTHTHTYSHAHPTHPHTHTCRRHTRKFPVQENAARLHMPRTLADIQAIKKNVCILQLFNYFLCLPPFYLFSPSTLSGFEHSQRVSVLLDLTQSISFQHLQHTRARV